MSFRSRPGFVEKDRTVSIFGFFKDGRMSTEFAQALGPSPWAFLGNDHCDVAFSAATVATNPGLATTVDDYARANGVTDDLLGLYAPTALGEMIMVVTMAGHVPTRDGDAGAEAPPPSPPPTSRRGGGGRGHRFSSPSGGRRSSSERDGVELSVSFFSVQLGRPVAVAETRYLGSSIETAWKTFTTKLAATLQGTTCRGWNAEIGIDAARLRKMIDLAETSSAP